MNITQITRPTENQFKNNFESLFQILLEKNRPSFLSVLDRTDLVDEAWSCFQKFKNYEDIVVLGIGGSSLGAKVLAEVFFAKQKVHFFENVDSLMFHKSVQALPDKTHFIIISKSGGTLETLAQVSFLVQKYGNKIYKQSVAITEKKSSPLFDWAQKHQVPVLEVPLDLGGRFSVLSPVGMYPALFMGIDINEMRLGAHQISQAKDLCAIFCSQIIQSFQNHEMITVFWAYSDLLRQFGFWIQQLWSESLGKAVDLSHQKAPFSSTPLPLLGSNDQHSVLQQIIEGQKDKFIVFLRHKESERYGDYLKQSEFSSQSFLQGKTLGEVLRAQYIGTQKALSQQGVYSLTIEVDILDSKSIGFLFVFFEMCVAMLGMYHNINTFDQPGVELSKKIAVDLLKSE